MTKETMRISIITAKSTNSVIGFENKLAWKQRNDLRRFKMITHGHCILFGRKTFESVGVLPNRTNIVVSSQKIDLPNVVSVQSIEQGIEYARDLSESELFIIGGGQIYSQSINLCDNLYITEIKAKIVGDSFFPEIPNEFKEIYRDSYPKDELNQFDYDFVIYTKKEY